MLISTEATDVILNLISIMIRMTPIFICLKPRHGSHENIAAVTVYIWTLMVSAQALFQIPDRQFVLFHGIFSAVFFLILMIFFKGSVMLKTFLYFSAWFVADLFSSLNMLFRHVFRAQTDIVYENMSLVLSIIVLVLYYFLFKYYLKDKTLRLFSRMSKRGSILLMMVPILFLILLQLGRQTVFREESLMRADLPTVVFYLGFCLIMLIIYFLTISDTSYAIDYSTVEEQLAAARQVVSLKRKNYKQIQEYQQRIRIIKHDFSHHVHALQHMTEEERHKYLNELEKQLEQSNDFIFCDNAAINSLLQEYKQRASDENVKFDVDIAIDKNLPADSLTICVILGNLLENAIEACMKCEEGRFITLQMRDEDEGLRIMVKNSYNGNIRIYNKVLQSTKKNGGLGMLSIRRLLDKPKDDFDFYYDEDVFVSMVYLSHES